jgi:hypothetical protein
MLTDEDLIKEITKRCAAKIMAAHQRADTLIEIVRFKAKEVLDGCSDNAAIVKSFAMWPDADLQEELTECMEACVEK